MAAGMTKTQLVRHLAEKTEINNKTAAAFLEQLADTAIKETKKNGVKTPKPTFSKRHFFTVSPFEPAMNCVPAQIAISVFRIVTPSK